MLKQCCRSGVEVVLQKMLLKWCWRKCFSKKLLLRLWQVSVHQPFFWGGFFTFLFSNVVDDGKLA
jgi:hypothetical protein